VLANEALQTDERRATLSAFLKMTLAPLATFAKTVIRTTREA
jgi:hypothetical protein